MNALTGITQTIGKRIIIPLPNNSDTWEEKMILRVDNLYGSGIIVFSDKNSNKHEIDMRRVQFL